MAENLLNYRVSKFTIAESKISDDVKLKNKSSIKLCLLDVSHYTGNVIGTSSVQNPVRTTIIIYELIAMINKNLQG